MADRADTIPKRLVRFIGGPASGIEADLCVLVGDRAFSPALSDFIYTVKSIGDQLFAIPEDENEKWALKVLWASFHDRKIKRL